LLAAGVADLPHAASAVAPRRNRKLCFIMSIE
jgi:hypothetical protein